MEHDLNYEILISYYEKLLFCNILTVFIQIIIIFLLLVISFTIHDAIKKNKKEINEESRPVWSQTTKKSK